MLVAVCTLCLVAEWATDGHLVPGVRRIEMRQRDDTEFRRIKSQVIDTKAKWDAFLESLNRKNRFERGGGKDDYPDFAKELMAAKIDFTKATLFLHRETAPSGSIRLYLRITELRDGVIEVRTSWEHPGAGTLDVAEHCFAFTVSKDRPRRLVFWEEWRRGSIDLPPKGK